jgi:hypothetical protein
MINNLNNLCNEEIIFIIVQIFITSEYQIKIINVDLNLENFF